MKKKIITIGSILPIEEDGDRGGCEGGGTDPPFDESANTKHFVFETYRVFFLSWNSRIFTQSAHNLYLYLRYREINKYKFAKGQICTVQTNHICPWIPFFCIFGKEALETWKSKFIWDWKVSPWWLKGCATQSPISGKRVPHRPRYKFASPLALSYLVKEMGMVGGARRVKGVESFLHSIILQSHKAFLNRIEKKTWKLKLDNFKNFNYKFTSAQKYTVWRIRFFSFFILFGFSSAKNI